MADQRAGNENREQMVRLLYLDRRYYDLADKDAALDVQRVLEAGARQGSALAKAWSNASGRQFGLLMRDLRAYTAMRAELDAVLAR